MALLLSMQDVHVPGNTHLPTKLNVRELQVEKLGRRQIFRKVDGISVSLLPSGRQRARLGRAGGSIQLVHGKNIKGAAHILVREEELCPSLSTMVGTASWPPVLLFLKKTCSYTLEEQPFTLLIAEGRVAKVSLHVPKLSVKCFVNGFAKLLRVANREK